MCPVTTGTGGGEMTDVQRWDVYDIADALADVPGMIHRVVNDQSAIGETLRDVYDLLAYLENQLWEAANRGGRVGPWPEYKQI